MCLSVTVTDCLPISYIVSHLRYTYGKPVPGSVKVQVCRKFSQSASSCYGKEAESVCEEFTRRVSPKIKT